MKIVCLIGEFASGKSELFKRLKNHPKLEGVITTTSRPIRTNETDGVDYNFKTKEEFISMIENDELVEWESFNNWYYGSTYESFDKNDKNKLIVINPSGFRTLRKKYGDDNVLGIVIKRDMREKCIDYLKRDINADVYEMCRRIKADEQDFKHINNHEYKNTYYVYNETGKFLKCIADVERIIGGYLN